MCSLAAPRRYRSCSRFAALALCLLLPWAGHATVVINEVMASNGSTLADEDGDYPDWIELYNTGSEAVNLEGWGLSDDYDDPFQWTFPDVTVGAEEFLLVFASNKDRRNPDAILHTNFAIGRDGDEIVITRPDEYQVDELPPTPRTSRP